jgi:hypothetical protein
MQWTSAPNIGEAPLPQRARGYWKARFSAAGEGLEKLLEAERTQLPPWVVVGLGSGIAAWFALDEAAQWKAFLCLGAALTLIRFSIGKGRAGQALGWFALAARIGCALVWERWVAVAEPRLGRAAGRTSAGDGRQRRSSGGEAKDARSVALRYARVATEDPSARSDGDPSGFARYEQRLRKFMESKQNGASRCAGAFCPKNRLRLMFRNWAASMLNVQPIAKFALSSSLVDDLDLADYAYRPARQPKPISSGELDPPTDPGCGRVPLRSAALRNGCWPDRDGSSGPHGDTS